MLSRHFGFSGQLADLTRHDIVRVLDKLKSTPSEQKHAFVALRTMMNWCVKRGYIDFSPVPPLTFRQSTRDRVLNDEELAKVWRRTGEFGYPFGPIVQLLILTGQRRSEIANLRRSWIAKDVIVFLAEFVKNGREMTLPLIPAIREVIDGVPDCAPDLLFPSRVSDEKAYDGFSRAKRNFDKPLEIEHYTLHDLRRTFSSNQARLGTPIHVTEKLLNHLSGSISGVAAVYNRHAYQEEMQDALQAHAEYLQTILI